MAYGVDVEVPDLRVVVRRPDVIVNTSLIPIQPVAEFALTASHAITASYALNAESGSGFPYAGDATITGSLYVVDEIGGLGGVTGSFTGSFVGDGSGLCNVFATADLVIDGGFADTEFDGTDMIFDGGGADASFGNQCV